VNVVPHVCGKVAIKQYNEFKSEVDNFLILVNNRTLNLDDKIKEIKNKKISQH
jgi:hypothetical protein